MDQLKILHGAESFHAEAGRVGVLMSHGYTGSPSLCMEQAGSIPPFYGKNSPPQPI